MPLGVFLDYVAFLGIFIHNRLAIMSEIMYRHQTLTDYVSDQYPQFEMMIDQM